jgi:glycosyltransferase involved in cell wall biosynthesis
VADGLDQRVSRRVARGDVALVYGYLEQARRSFEAATSCGTSRILEAHYVHWATAKSIVDLERVRNPEWESLLPPDSIFAYSASQQDRELELCDALIAPSAQVRESVNRANPTTRVVHLPYGVPDEVKSPRVRSWRDDRPLELLFVGRLTPLKGLADLQQALAPLGGAVHLTIVGPKPHIRNRALDAFIAAGTYVGAVSRATVYRLMDQSDLFILPSLVEGRSLAVLEALSSALPAVVTPGTGAEDAVAQSGGGLVVGAAQPDQLRSAIEAVLGDPDSVERMSGMALDTRGDWGWQTFYQGLGALISSVLAERNAS